MNNSLVPNTEYVKKFSNSENKDPHEKISLKNFALIKYAMSVSK